MFLSLVVAAVVRADSRPNILLIIGDDVGYGELQCYNPLSITPTPHIDQLARTGVRFTNTHVAEPICGPSRVALMTGKYPSRFGLEMHGGGKEFGVPPSVPLLSEYLQSAGYSTTAIGKWHLGWQPAMQPLNNGFDHFFGFGGGGSGYYDTSKKRHGNQIHRDNETVDEPDYLTFAFTREANRYIENHARDDHPFFLYLPFSAIHTPFEAPPEYVEKFASIADRKRRYLSAMLSAHDDAVGSVLATLDREGIAENTLVIYLSDNGGEWAPHVDNRPLRGSKFRIWEGGVRVPMIWNWPSKAWSDGRTFKGLVSELDLMPTILKLARVDTPSDLDGESLIPEIGSNRSNAGNSHKPLYFRYGPEFAINDGRWKLSQTEDPETHVIQRGLYDLEADIGETTNRLSTHREFATQLLKQYSTWANKLPPPLWWGWPRPGGDGDD